jgi:hypothetical protein
MQLRLSPAVTLTPLQPLTRRLPSINTAKVLGNNQRHRIKKYHHLIENPPLLRKSKLTHNRHQVPTQRQVPQVPQSQATLGKGLVHQV